MSQRFQQTKSTTDGNLRVLKTMLALPSNKKCADCKTNDSRWAAWNVGVFICIRCSGIHRSMGTHISKVKSIDLDTWQQEQIASMQKYGNTLANAYWESGLKEGHVPAEHKIDSFIRSKYDSKRWAASGTLQEFQAGGPVVVPTPALQHSSQSSATQRSLLDLDDLGYDIDPAAKAHGSAPIFSPSPQDSRNQKDVNSRSSPGQPDKANSAALPVFVKPVAKKADIMSLFGKLPPATSSVPSSSSNFFSDFNSNYTSGSNSAVASSSSKAPADLFDFNSLSITPATTTASVSISSNSIDSNDSFGDWNSATISKPISASPASSTLPSFDSWKSDPIAAPLKPTMPTTTLWSQANPAAAAIEAQKSQQQQSLKTPTVRPPSWSTNSIPLTSNFQMKSNAPAAVIPSFPVFDAWNESAKQSPPKHAMPTTTTTPLPINTHHRRSSSGVNQNAWDTSHQWNPSTAKPEIVAATVTPAVVTISNTASAPPPSQGLDHFMNNAWSTPHHEDVAIPNVHNVANKEKPAPSFSDFDTFDSATTKITPPVPRKAVTEELDVWGGWN